MYHLISHVVSQDLPDPVVNIFVSIVMVWDIGCAYDVT